MTCVLVVDDSQFMRTVVGNALTDAGYEVETASNGVEAIEAVAAYDPDVVTMDVEMPNMSGIEAVERIMSTHPTAILMLSAYTERGAEATLDALERGAIGFLHKPDGSGSRNIAHLADEVVEKVDELSQANVSSLALARASAAVHSTGPNRIKRPVSVSSTSQEKGRGSALEPVTVDDETREDLTVIVGASTGGPKIVERLFSRLPAELGATVLVVQHMPSDFTARFAGRLDAISEYHVREARDSDQIRPGEALVAPGGYHLEVRNDVGGTLRVGLDDGPRIHGVKPAIDVTMGSAADRVSGALCGVVLSGMGCDGAAGIEAVSDAGGYTIAQDERTSPVFGIPKQAIETGRVDEVVPAPEIAERIVTACSTEGEIDD